VVARMPDLRFLKRLRPRLAGLVF